VLSAVIAAWISVLAERFQGILARTVPRPQVSEIAAEYVVAKAEQVSFGRTGAGEGDRFTAGSMTVTAMATPGHTPAHLSYVLREGDGEPLAVFISVRCCSARSGARI
jgi:glyoxylase-like metal-dependent hydrolase (beta-lactamase superfamily II)